MGRKRHIVTDTAGHLVGLIVHIASIQDRDGAVAVLASIRRLYPWLRTIFADGGYAGDKLRHALLALGRWTMQIIKQSDTAQGFEVLPRRWVVERTFAWLGRCRRLAKDFETNVASSTSWTLIAHVRRLTRTLAYCGEARMMAKRRLLPEHWRIWRNAVVLNKPDTWFNGVL